MRLPCWGRCMDGRKQFGTKFAYRLTGNESTRKLFVLQDILFFLKKLNINRYQYTIDINQYQISISNINIKYQYQISISNINIQLCKLP